MKWNERSKGLRLRQSSSFARLACRPTGSTLTSFALSSKFFSRACAHKRIWSHPLRGCRVPSRVIKRKKTPCRCLFLFRAGKGIVSPQYSLLAQGCGLTLRARCKLRLPQAHNLPLRISCMRQIMPHPLPRGVSGPVPPGL